jgi:hypothetical protein
MPENFQSLKSILERLDQTGFLGEVLLIGSWASYFYGLYYQSPDYRPLIRTTDVDFLIPNPRKINPAVEVDLGKVFEDLHFVKSRRWSGLVKYESKDLTIEFLVPELGRGGKEPLRIKQFNITAQPLRFLNMLTENSLVVPYEGMKVRVPDPVAYGFHKLLISPRRLKKEKASKDYLAAVEVLHFLRKKGEGRKIAGYFRSLPGSWKEKIQTTLESGKEGEILEEIKYK